MSDIRQDCVDSLDILAVVKEAIHMAAAVESLRAAHPTLAEETLEYWHTVIRATVIHASASVLDQFTFEDEEEGSDEEHGNGTPWNAA